MALSDLEKRQLFDLIEKLGSGSNGNENTTNTTKNNYTPRYRGGFSRYGYDIENDDTLSRNEKLLKIKERAKELEEEINELQDERRELLEDTTKTEEDRKKALEENSAQLRECNRELKGLQDSSKNVRFEFTRTLDTITNVFRSIDNEFMRMMGPWSEVDKASSNFARNIGLAEKGMKALRQEAMQSVGKGKIGIDFNMSAQELIDAQEKYVKNVGRNLRIGFGDQQSLAAISSIYKDSGNELMVGFERFGLSITEVGDHLGKLFSDASKNGVSLEAYAKNVQTGLAMAQTYTFRGGLKSMEEMAKKAAAIRMDMKQVEALANKAGTLEGALQTAAKLQVLGGNFAALSDPIAMLNESLTDMEALGDRIGKMTKNMGHFNKVTGEVTISAFDKQRLRAVAEATGMDYNNLIEQTQQQAKRGEIQAQIRTSKAGGLSEDFKELIANTATFKEGKAGISIGGEFKTLDQLKEKDYEELLKETQTESQDIKQIAKDVRSLVDIRSGVKKQYENTKARLTSPLGEPTKKVTNAVGHAGLLLGGIALGSIGMHFARIVETIFGGFNFTKNKVGRLFRRGGGAGGGSVPTAENIARGGAGRRGPLGRIFNRGAQVPTAAARTTSMRGAVDAGSATIGRRGASRALTRAAVKTLGKNGATKLLSVGSKLATGMAKGGPLSLIGAVGNIATDALVDSGKIKKGGGAHAALKVGSQTATGAGIGAMIGSIIPGIGTAVGTAVGAGIGAIVGAAQADKAKKEIAIDNKLEKLGIERQGKYSSSQLSKLDKALETGRMSNKLRRKLEREGDTEIVEKAKEVKAQRKEEREARIDKRLERKEKRAEIRKKTSFGVASFEVGVANFNGVGINKLGSSLSALNPIKAGVRILRGKKEDGKSEALNEINSIRNRSALRNNNNNQSVPGTFDININGTLRLESGNGQSVDLMSVIRDNPRFKTELAELISEEIRRINNNGRVQNSPFGSRDVKTS